MNYPSDIDKELIPLLDSLNSLSGIATEFSCSGHEEIYEDCGSMHSSFYVMLKSDSIRSVNIIQNAISRFNENIDNHGYEIVVEFGMCGNRYYTEESMNQQEVSIRARKCHMPVKFEHLEELRQLVEKEKDKYGK